MLPSEIRHTLGEVSDHWWLFLIGGVAWFVISLVVLRLDIASVATVGVLMGVVFLLSGFEEVFIASVRSGWRWARVLMAVVFFAGSIWSFITPFGAFWSLASVLGFLLVFKGSLDIFESVATQPFNPIWGLGLATGILEVGLGSWASQQLFPARALLLLLWVGFYAMFRGFSEIALAFQLRPKK